MKLTKSYIFQFPLLLATSTLLILAFVGSQVFISWDYKRRSQEIQEELAELKVTNIDEEKTRQETIKLRLENEQQNLFLRTLLINLSSTVGVIVALSGAWVGLGQYFSARHKEQLDRLANDLNKLWDGLTSNDENIRAGSIAGLQHFLSPENKEFHERVASALALVGRLHDNSLVVQRTLTPVIEYAMREIPDVMKKISWQGLKLYRPNFSGLDFSNFDLRDCDLRNANFSQANLSKAKCNAALFVGATFDKATLCEADLEYADLANASFKETNLRGTKLYDVKIMHMDLEKAQLQDAEFLASAIDWRLSRNWRKAEFNAELKKSLLEKYGPELTKPRVLMLLWEFFPVVSGGVWTAVYHLLKNLRMRGTDLIVMVPWPPSAVSYYEFGYELELIPVGTEQPSEEQTEIIEEAYSEYSWLSTSSYTSGLYDSEIADSVSIFDMVNEFTKRACKVVEEKKLEFDIIHAHDWVTFMAAESLSKIWKKPWVAHFHSTEYDRRNLEISISIKKVEQMACRKSNHLITPSNFTKQILVELYRAPEDKITVAPNCLSDEEDDNKLTSGEFQSEKVIFLGRLTYQKGPDIFIEIAKEVLDIQPNVEFVVFGKGEMESELIEEDYQKEVHNPAPQVIEGMKDSSSQFSLNQFIEFEQVVPINYIAETNSIELLRGSLSNKKRTQFERLAFKHGFTAYAGDFTAYADYYDDAYTHRIIINDLEDNLHVDYLVKASGLKNTSITETTRKLVSLQGFIDWDKRRKAFENATLIIVPSRFEPFGMIVLEAMQEGVPVMFSKTAGVGEVIKSGIAINQENAKEIAQQVVKILNDKVSWQKVVEAQANEIDNYNKRKYESIILDVWKALIAK